VKSETFCNRVSAKKGALLTKGVGESVGFNDTLGVEVGVSIVGVDVDVSAVGVEVLS
jgi:hypothetical protein